MTKLLRRRRCRDCRAEVWTGLDGDLCAQLVTVTAAPLGHLGEALARLQGRGTYLRTRHLDGTKLARRDHWQIAGPRPERADVVAEHRCRTPLPTVPSRLPKPPTKGPTADADAAPPF